MNMTTDVSEYGSTVHIPSGTVILEGDLYIPKGAHGVVLFAHGSGSSRFSPRNRFVAQALQKAGFATLLMDLLTREEEAIDMRTAHLRFDIELLAQRLVSSTDWIKKNTGTKKLHIGYFGASTGAAAALIGAVERPSEVSAVVSRGGRPDLAGKALPQVKAPTLLIVGGNDTMVITINRQAFEQLRAKKDLIIVPGATHLFEEPGALGKVAQLAADWFKRHLESNADVTY